MNVIVKSKWEWEMGYSRKKTKWGVEEVLFEIQHHPPPPPSSVPGIFKFFTLPLEIP